MEQQEMLEREQAAQQMAAAEKQRAEAAQSAARLAPWAKKAQVDAASPAVTVNGGHAATSGAPGGGESGLSLAEIQKLEEERERELQLQREIEEQQMREIRRREEEENSKRQQVLHGNILLFCLGFSLITQNRFKFQTDTNIILPLFNTDEMLFFLEPSYELGKHSCFGSDLSAYVQVPRRDPGGRGGQGA